MTVFKTIQSHVAKAVEDLVSEGALSLKLPMPLFVIEPPRDPMHGDVATNAAMLLTKSAGKPPRAIAELLKAKLEAMPEIASVEIAGPGFINMRLNPDVWQEELRVILKSGIKYGDSSIGNHERVNVEFVSANPTGPMHAGHVRGAVLGDTLSNLLSKAGYDVTKEYYFNDAGSQVDVLARTSYLRYCEALG
ncbi:MAG: arginine--tRNA ligase, partial [Alphaproteobacteria bacterium]|nr:arginine--tRNA ligase [Alphaproteobacteria bacterium]